MEAFWARLLLAVAGWAHGQTVPESQDSTSQLPISDLPTRCRTIGSLPKMLSARNTLLNPAHLMQHLCA